MSIGRPLRTAAESWNTFPEAEGEVPIGLGGHRPGPVRCSGHRAALRPANYF